MTEKKKRFNISLLKLSTPSENCASGKRNWKDVLLEQIIDSAIIGGIAGLSAYIGAGQDAGLKTFGIAFALAFLLKLKEYRKL